MRTLGLVVFLALAAMTLLASSRFEPTPVAFAAREPAPFTGRLSILTYNIHGLPWPVALGRDADFTRIAARLGALRRQGDGPNIVVLQEAFTPEARAIGRQAGYRYVVNGPSDMMVSHQPPTASDARYAAADSWLKGEGLPKFVGSGLQILSDYPIVDTREMVFPAFACAGYDCLANKGALLARVELPGHDRPVDIVTLHLNSRRASGVARARSNQAYQLQIACLAAFIRANHDPRNALFVAGDFNMGSDPSRIAELNGTYPHWVSHEAISDVYDVAASTGLPLSPDALFSRRRARDRLFFAAGEDLRFALRGIEVPFGHSPSGTMLSDHVGYAAIFSASGPLRPVTTAARLACPGTKPCARAAA